MTENRTIYINGTEAGIGNKFKAQVIERRPGHPDCGKVIRETPWASNLILETGMTNIASKTICSLFPYCCIGSGTTPTVVSSGTVTATTSGTTCTSSVGFFSSGMANQLIYFPGTGQSAVITHYTDTQNVTLSAALAIGSGIVFEIYAINQTGLGTEVHRTNTYLTGAGNCGTTYSGGVYTHTRTYDFPIEIGNQSYSEVGFSDNATPGANLNMRGIFSTAPISVVIGQQLRVIYNVLVTATPISPRSRTVPISGWPALAYPVAVTPSSSAITLTGLPGYSFPQNTVVFFDGTLNPTGITFGATYYANPAGIDAAGYVSVSATPSGSAIAPSTAGTNVDLYTNTHGYEQLSGHQFSGVDTSGNTIDYGVGAGSAVGEPSEAKSMCISTNTAALVTFPTTVFASSGDIPVGGSQPMVAGNYSAGSYTLTWSVTFTVDQGNSSVIQKLITLGSSSMEGLVYFFDMPQQKTNLYTLTVVWQFSWQRILT